MSIEFWMEAVRDHLRSTLAFPGGADKAVHYVDIQPNGQPPAAIGDYYIAVDEASIESADKTHLKEIFQLEVTITKTIGQFRKDQLSSAYFHHSRGLGPIESSVKVAIHNNQDLRALANFKGGLPSTVNGDQFIQPLWYLGRGRTRFEAGDWAGLEPDKKAFMVRVLRFGGGIRTQALDVMR